jgi:hypothetical protein
LQFFLEETRVGYDVHFATAATLMFRYYGIPARYVEGYLITPRDAAEAQPGVPLTLRGDEHAHAWTEIYQDGIGWVPFEATPPYVGIMEYPDDLRGVPNPDGAENGPPPEEAPAAETAEDEGDSIFSVQMISLLIRLVLSAAAVALLLLLVYFLIRLGQRRRRLKDRLAGFERTPYAEAIENIFRYAMDILYAMGLPEANGSLYEQAPAVSALFEESPDAFLAALQIHQEARFSGHEMSEEQAEAVKSFQQAALRQLIATAKPARKFTLRLLRGLY